MSNTNGENIGNGAAANAPVTLKPEVEIPAGQFTKDAPKTQAQKDAEQLAEARGQKMVVDSGSSVRELLKGGDAGAEYTALLSMGSFAGKTAGEVYDAAAAALSAYGRGDVKRTLANAAACWAMRESGVNKLWADDAADRMLKDSNYAQTLARIWAVHEAREVLAKKGLAAASLVASVSKAANSKKDARCDLADTAKVVKAILDNKGSITATVKDLRKQYLPADNDTPAETVDYGAIVVP